MPERLQTVTIDCVDSKAAERIATIVRDSGHAAGGVTWTNASRAIVEFQTREPEKIINANYVQMLSTNIVVSWSAARD